MPTSCSLAYTFPVYIIDTMMSKMADDKDMATKDIAHALFIQRNQSHMVLYNGIHMCHTLSNLPQLVYH